MNSEDAIEFYKAVVKKHDVGLSRTYLSQRLPDEPSSESTMREQRLLIRNLPI